MTRLLIAAVLLTLLFTLLVGGLSLQAQNNPVTAVFGDCSMPCWHGIQPGVSAWNDVTAWFRALGWTQDNSFCHVLSPQCIDFHWWNPAQRGQLTAVHFVRDHIDLMRFERPGLTLGDLLLALGAPDDAEQYTSFVGTPVTFYLAWWGGIEAELRLDCPTTFAALLQKPLQAVALAESPFSSRIRDSSPGVIVSHSFRRVCAS